MIENQRIRLSKQMLRDSLTKLLSERSIHKISVREICNLAQINRTTFYKYYGSQYDLLKDMENEVLSQIDRYLSDNNVSVENSLQLIFEIVTFINSNYELCRILLNNNVDSEFPARLINLTRIRQLITTCLQTEYSENELEYVFNSIVNAGFSIIKSWINKEKREEPEVIAAILNNTILKLFPASALS